MTCYIWIQGNNCERCERTRSQKMLTQDIWVLPVADSVQVLSPDSRRNQGSHLSSQQRRPAPCTISSWTTGYDICAVFPRSAMLLSPLVYPAGTLCHNTNSICQQSAADKPRATILASATSGLGPCCLAKQLLDGLRNSLLLAISTTLE